jgi:hypothetical protein
MLKNILEFFISGRSGHFCELVLAFLTFSHNFPARGSKDLSSHAGGNSHFGSARWYSSGGKRFAAVK